MTVRIERIQFRNFRVLRDAELPLGPLTIIVGPNGSGKSTVWEALWYAQLGQTHRELPQAADVSHGAPDDLQVTLVFHDGSESTVRTLTSQRWTPLQPSESGAAIAGFTAALTRFEFDPTRMTGPCPLRAHETLDTRGSNLAGVLDRLRDEHPERFEALNEELPRWFPEFDRVLFETPHDGHRSFALRSRRSRARVPASSLSAGTRSALCLLALAHLADPPSLAFIEEPDAGVHPRLLQQIKDALVRLAYPRENGIDREPCQVIATTHSPYLLDLFRDHLDQVVISSRDASGATFQRLSEYPHVEEILGSGSLGEAWFTGILGGVPLEA